MTYLIPVLILGICGACAGILLTFASKFFYVKADERVDKIADALPHANCGACGYAGCADYADAVVNKNAPTNLCRPGGKETTEKVSEIMGTVAETSEPVVFIVNCHGDCEATSKKFSFDGVQSCKAAKRFYGGDGLCKYGCLGYGDCMNVCGENAISIKNGIAEINPSLCKACGQCADVCPNHVISMRPVKNKTVVFCKSEDNGKQTKMNCKNGCIGCKICEKKCNYDAVKVNNFHAEIDYGKCVSCGECAAACPTKAIRVL